MQFEIRGEYFLLHLILFKVVHVDINIWKPLSSSLLPLFSGTLIFI